jgi:hypothetical protein
VLFAELGPQFIGTRHTARASAQYNDMCHGDSPPLDGATGKWVVKIDFLCRRAPTRHGRGRLCDFR